MSKPLAVKKQYRVYALGALASHFGIPRDEMSEEVSLEENGLLYFESLDKYQFRYHIHAAHIDKLKLETFINYKAFVKSTAYAEYLNGQGLLENSHDGYMMYMHFNGIGWYVYEDDSYRGFGGMFVCENHQSKTGFVIEPCVNYLKANFPTEEF